MKKFLIVFGILLVIAFAFLNPLIAFVLAVAGGALLWKGK